MPFSSISLRTGNHKPKTSPGSHGKDYLPFDRSTEDSEESEDDDSNKRPRGESWWKGKYHQYDL